MHNTWANDFCFSFFQQEENNNSVSNDQSVNDSSYANQVLQSLSQNVQVNNLDTNSDSLLALAVALRTTSNVSPSSLIHHNGRINGSDNRFTATSSLEKLLSPGLSEMDNLSINNAPHRTADNEGNNSFSTWLEWFVEINWIQNGMQLQNNGVSLPA